MRLKGARPSVSKGARDNSRDGRVADALDCEAAMRTIMAMLTLWHWPADALQFDAQMKGQWPRPRFPCSCCDGELVLCWGDVLRPYLRHVVGGKDCSGSGEGIVHRLAKEGLAEYLLGGERVIFTDVYPRRATVSVSAGGSVKMEHILSDGGRADIALLDAAGKAEAIIEIMDSHMTDSPRPEPWYEVRANSVFELLNARASGEQATLPPLICERNRSERMHTRKRTLRELREENEAERWAKEEAYWRRVEEAERDKRAKEETLRAAREEEQAAKDEERAKRAKEEAKARDKRVAEAGKRPRAAYEKLRAEWDGEERRSASRKRQFEMLAELIDAAEEWWTAERKAGYEKHVRAAEGLWKHDHQIGIFDDGLVADWEALGESRLRIGRYEGHTYMQIHNMAEEKSAAGEEALSYMSWASSVANARGQLADLQAWCQTGASDILYGAGCNRWRGWCD